MNNQITLNNKHTIPQIGLGTWRITGKEKVEEVLTNAIDLGYRHIDTALVYENEKEIGEALSSLFKQNKVKREDLFITSKLWNSYHDRAEEGIKKTLSDLGLDYLDLYLIHWPVNFQHDENGITLKDNEGKPKLNKFDPVAVWKEMEGFVKKGLVKSIGMSNFGITNLQIILDNCKIKPAICQFELNPYCKQRELVKFYFDNDIAVTSYSSLGSEPTKDIVMREDQVLKEIAGRNKVTVTHVVLSWIVMKNIVIIPKSCSREHLKHNLEIICLSDEDVEKIENIDTEYRLVNVPDFGPDRFK